MSYEINEDMARRAHEMRSTRDYAEGSATAEYQRQVDEARRIAEMEAAVQENAQPVAMEDLPGITYHENSSTMRVQLIFEGKPEPDIRAILKSHAFKWCPSQGAWQRQLTENGKRAAREVLAQIRMLQNGGEQSA